MTRWLLIAVLAAPASVTVQARDNAFSPPAKTVRTGNRVTFANTGRVVHDVNADDGSFASGDIAPGASWTYTAAKNGTLAYFCRYHPGMNGKLVVSSSALPQTGGGRQVQAGIATLLVTAVTGALIRRAW